MSLCLAALWLLCAAEEPQAPRMREQLFASGRPMLAVEEIQANGTWVTHGMERAWYPDGAKDHEGAWAHGLPRCSIAGSA